MKLNYADFRGSFGDLCHLSGGSIFGVYFYRPLYFQNISMGHEEREGGHDEHEEKYIHHQVTEGTENDFGQVCRLYVNRKHEVTA